MIAVDSNVLLRLVLDDDPEQSPVVQQIYDRAGPAGIFVGLLVIVELAWVLRRGYREKPEDILEMIEGLLLAREFRVERPDLVRLALADARAAHCGVADALIARVGEDAGAETTLTFDMRAKRLPTMRDAAAVQ